MFSRPLILSAVVATAYAGKSFLPFQGLSKAAGSFQAADKAAYDLIKGSAYVEADTCQQCLIGGYEYVMTLAAEYVPGGVAAAKGGFCCVPGIYGATSCSSVASLTTAMQSSKDWATHELALANCPNLTAMCGATQTFDLDANAGVAVTATVGAAGVTMTKLNSCSYIVHSKCKAPTVDFALPTATDAIKTNIYDISYVEYSENSFTAATTAQKTITVAEASSESSISVLGGELFPVLWKNAAGTSQNIASDLIASWMAGKAVEYKAYTDLVTGAAYKASVDKYDYYAAGKAWTKAWGLANVGTTIDAAILKPYVDALKTVTNAANSIITIAPEKPMVPILPIAYNGPAFHTNALVAQPVSSFTLLGGMGLPSLGKLGFTTASGFGHTFGTRGQGNENVSAPSSDTAKNYLHPAQPTDIATCKPSWLIVNVKGTVDQVAAGSTLVLTFLAKDFDTNPFILGAAPTATLIVPMARESANFLAAGVATVAMVAASLY